MITDEQFARLPRYAQQEIERLRGNERYHNRRLAEMDRGPDAPVRIGSSYNGGIGLPDDVVRFKLGEAPEAYVEVQRNGHGRVHIHAGTPRASILMSASNSFDVRLEGR